MSIIRTDKYEAVRYVEDPSINPKEYSCSVNISEMEQVAGPEYVVKCIPIFCGERLLSHYVEIRKKETNKLDITLMPGNWLVRYKCNKPAKNV